MPRNVRTISINLNAGTAKFFADLDSAKAKIREFGHAGVSEAKATTAAMKALEGNFFNNTRAADKFLESVLGLGPVLRVAFPLVGGVAFAGMLGEVGEKLFEFYKKIREAPERIEGSFRMLNAPLRLMNDELAAANDRLRNDIAKLEGHHQNTLALALDEARVAADTLADSLDKDLAGLHKLLEQENISRWKTFYTGNAPTSDLMKQIGGETGFGGFRGEVAQITDEGNEKIRQATTLKAKDAAQTELNTRLLAAYRKELAIVDLAIAQTASDEKFQAETEYTGGTIDYGPRLETARAVRRQIGL